MLESLRRASQTWIVKGLLILLVLSFGVWGVSTSLVTGTSQAVVSVGDVDVSTTDLRMAYERQLSVAARQYGTRLTHDQARALGIDQQVIAQMIAGASLDQLASTMNLGLSQDQLARTIAEEPAFRSVNGQFDRQLFSSTLRNAGLREDDYINSRSKVAVRQQIVDAVSDGYSPPKAMVDALRQFRNETRSIDYILLSNANIDPIKAPGDDVLAPWFEAKKAAYRAPEYRKLTYVKLEPEDIADFSKATDEDLRATYDRQKDAYRTPATRTIEQLNFPDKGAADAALARLNAGSVTFDALVTEQGKTLADVRLGDFTKDVLPDPKVADAAFAVTQNGQTTPVVDGVFGPVILRITNIQPETVKSFEDVKEELRRDFALSLAQNEILGIHDQFEDARAGGASLVDAARQVNLKAVTIDAIDATGKTPDDDEVADLPERQTVLADAFKADVGGDPTVINIGREGYLWLEVNDSTPARDRTLAEARDRVLTDWTAEQQTKALEARALELKARVSGGETLAAIATDMGLAVETKVGLRRGTQDAALSPAAIRAAFAGPNGLVGNAAGTDGDGQILFKVTDVAFDTATDALDNSDAQIEAAARASGDDILDQMVDQLETSYSVSVNRPLADATMAAR